MSSVNQAAKPQADAAHNRNLLPHSSNGAASNLKASITAQAGSVVEARSPIEGFDGVLDVHDENPQDIMGPATTSQARRTSLWTALSALLIVALALQYLWFNRLFLAQDVGWRPYYLLACQYAGCDLTEFDDITQLSTVDLLVRSHPDRSAVLTVEAMLKNSALYRQKYPHVRLNFIDKSGRTLAARTFTAADYLGGELRGGRMIAANTGVKLSLTVVDPGPGATGYSMQVVPGAH